MVYIPILIQVPTPSHPSSVISVNNLNEIRPGKTIPGDGLGGDSGPGHTALPRAVERPVQQEQPISGSWWPW
jgi:hypothetical protein